jgi:WD40 repeat protein/ABC-type dipeptide/oligopeptide/nickel transport system ATPase component
MSQPHQNPFPGLRPFLFHEHDLFFGREEQYEQMVDKLATTRFLAVVGSSGSGKSSLVRAGLLPALYDGAMMSAGKIWRVALFRPKDDPIRELAQALNHRRVFGDPADANGSSLLSVGDVIDWPALCSSLNDEAKKSQHSPGKRILEFLSPVMRQNILDITGKVDLEQEYKPQFVDAFNDILKRREFYSEQGFARVPIPDEAQMLLSRGQENLSQAEILKVNRLLLEASYPRKIASASEKRTRITEVSLRRGDLGLIEAVRQAKMPQNENLLVVVDQFEELFRYARISEHGPHGDQAAAFVKLLLKAKSQKEIPIYVVLTMRSDYLGDCVKFSDLPEAINESQYLTPRLTRDQLREAIIGPIKAFGANITPQLVNQFINEMGDSQDQLPILQHALMRTWDEWEKKHREDEPIDVHHYEAIGRMANALSLHADEAYNELPDERSREIAKKVFKCLTERGSRNREIRRPTAVKEIHAITRASFKEIIPVVNIFRQEGRSFLMPSPRKPLTRHTSIDISHESLIRNWTKLKEWVQEEAQAANAYRRLVESVRLYDAGEAPLLSELEVEYALKWHQDNEPNLAWASRYHTHFYERTKTSPAGPNAEQIRKEQDKKIFKRAMDFLEESRTMRAQEREDKKKQDRAQLKRTRIAVAVLFGLTVLCFGLLILSYIFRREAEASAVQAMENAKQAQASERLTNLFTYVVNINNAQKAFADNKYSTAYGYLDILRDAKYESMYGFEWHHLTRISPQEIVLLSANGKRVDSMHHRSPVIAATFLPDMTTLATAASDGTITRWDMNTQQEIPNWDLPDSAKNLGPGSIIAFSPNGEFMATVRGDRKTITVDYLNRNDPWQLNNARDNIVVQSLAFSPDGTKLAGVLAETKEADSEEASPTATEQIIVWERNKAPQSLPLPKSTEIHFTAVAFSGDKQHIAVGFSDGGVNRCDTTGSAFKCHRINLGADANTLSVQDISTGERVKTNVQALAFSPDQKMLAVAYQNGIITLWDMEQGRPLPYRPANTDTISTVAFSPDGQNFAAASSKGIVKSWKTADFKQATQNPQNGIKASVVLTGHAGPVLSMAFLPGSSILATTSEDNTIKLWDIDRKEKTEETFKGPLTGFLALPRAADGKERFAVLLGDTLRFVNRTGEGFTPSADRFQGVHPDDFQNISSTAYSLAQQRKLLSVFRLENGTAARVKLWDLDALKPSGRELTIPVDKIDQKIFDWIKSVSPSMFSQDGNMLAIWSPLTGIIRFDTVNGASSVKLLTKDSKVIPLPSRRNLNASVFSHDLTIFVQSIEQKDRGSYLQVFNANTGEWIAQLDCPAPALSIAFSPDGKRLAAGLRNNTVRLWEIGPSWKKLDDLIGHDSPVQAVVFSPDSKRLATGSLSGAIKLWDVSPEHWNMRPQLWKLLRLSDLVTIEPTVDNSKIKSLSFSPDGKMLIVQYFNNKIKMLGGS